MTFSYDRDESSDRSEDDGNDDSKDREIIQLDDDNPDLADYYEFQSFSDSPSLN